MIMIGKADWTKYLHAIRKREIDLVFSLLTEGHFDSGLEIGAGDGYQTTLLAQHINNLTSSDLNFERLKDELKVTRVLYKRVDADAIEGVFVNKVFDLVFSSNVLEHLRDPKKFLISSKPTIKDNGYAVHIVPSRHIKVSYLALYYPYLILLLIDRVIGKIKGRPFFRGGNINLENNINSVAKPERKKRKFLKILFPSPHGNYETHWQEYVAFGRKSWERMFINAGYTIVSYRKGPAFSGYGFGLSRIRKVLETLGISSEHIFILEKMSEFEYDAWAFTNTFLARGSFYERQKFVGDWMKKEGNAKAFVEDFMNAVGDPRGKKVLDIGFGNGIILSEFSRAGAQAYGLETEDKLLGLAKKCFDDNKVSANLSVYDGARFPFSDNYFDYAYSTSVLEHMSHPERVLHEISRVLVPGGKFYLSFPNKYAPKESHTGLWFISWLPRPITKIILRLFGRSPLEDWNLHFISFFNLKKMAEGAGLRIMYDTGSNTFLKRLIKKILALNGAHYGVFLKTIILTLEKPIHTH